MNLAGRKFDWSHFCGHPLQDFSADFMAASGEFTGTLAFLLVGLGGIQASAISNRAGIPQISANAGAVPSIEHLMYISASMGLSLLFSAWIFYRATGAAFNPNVSLALLLTGVIKPMRFLLYVVAQLAASIVASALLKLLLPGPMSVAPALTVGTSPAQGVFIEAFATCALVLSVLFLAVEKHRATYLAPVGISITLFACHLFAVIFTGAAMNSARAFGPAVVSGFRNDQWIYWVGPTLGSLMAVAIYVFMKLFEYWKLNEGQDSDVFSASPALFIARPAGDNSNNNNTVRLCQAQPVEKIWIQGQGGNHDNNRGASSEYAVKVNQVEQLPV